MAVEKVEQGGQVGTQRRHHHVGRDGSATERVGIEAPTPHPAVDDLRGPQSFDELVEVVDSREVDAGRNVQSQNRMDVSVDETGCKGCAAQVDDLSRRRDVGGQRIRVAEGADPPVGDGDSAVALFSRQGVDGLGEDHCVGSMCHGHPCVCH